MVIDKGHADEDDEDPGIADLFEGADEMELDASASRAVSFDEATFPCTSQGETSVSVNGGITWAKLPFFMIEMDVAF